MGSRDLWPRPLRRQQSSPRALDLTLSLLPFPSSDPTFVRSQVRKVKKMIPASYSPASLRQHNPGHCELPRSGRNWVSHTVSAVAEWIHSPLCEGEGKEKFLACLWNPHAEGLVVVSLLGLCDMGINGQPQHWLPSNVTAGRKGGKAG